MNSITYRPASIMDLPAILGIRFSVNENRLSKPNQVTAQIIEDYFDVLISAGESDLRGWVCEEHGKVVGYCYAEKGKSSIWALFILPGHEGKGIGKTLLNIAVDWLFGVGKEQIRLSTGINTRAERFYQSLGWRRMALKNQHEVWYCLRKMPHRMA